MQTFTVTTEKFVHGGQALARVPQEPPSKHAGKACFVWGALPQETVEINLIKKKPDYVEAIVTKVIQPSAERIAAKEASYLATSPWQMLDPTKEQYYKQQIARETYQKIGDLNLHESEPRIYTNDQWEGYRNKMEFSFTEQEGRLSLAFFQRGGKARIAVDSSILCHPLINRTAQEILAWMNEQHIPIRSAKSLIVRTATNTAGETYAVAALFIKDRLTFDYYPRLSLECKGFQLYYSTHKSPASVVTDTLYSDGQDYLEQAILGMDLRFGLLSFFQVNPPVFEQTLKDIAAFLDPTAPLLDFYSGVGAIGLPLSQHRSSCICVDSNPQAIDFAHHNIAKNGINASAHCSPAETIVDMIQSDVQIILDPPRAGLHEKVINRLALRRPPRIIYLSCNLSTQARDIRMLSEYYRPVYFQLYNYFPRTPHIEGLCVLEKL